MSVLVNAKLNIAENTAMASVCHSASVMPENNCVFSLKDTSFEVSFF